MESLSSLIPFLIIAFWIYTLVKRNRAAGAKGQREPETSGSSASLEAAETKKPAPAGESFFAGLSRQYQEMQAAAQHDQRREATGGSTAPAQDVFTFSGEPPQAVRPRESKQVVTSPGGPVITSKPIEPTWWA